MPFNFRSLKIPELIIIEPQVFQDVRGFFMESYKYSEFASYGIVESFVQDNHSYSKKGVLRGLHYQNPPRGQGKLVRVILGEIFDVAVDIRKGSPTFGKWVGVVLSAEDRKMLYIPPGFAHGFCVLSDDAEVLYKSTDEYAPEYEAGIVWNDPEIGVDWPVKDPIISSKDASLPALRQARNEFLYKNEKV